MQFKTGNTNKTTISKMKSVIASLQDDNANLQANIESLQEQNNKLAAKINWFEEQFKLGRYRQFGKQSETSHSLNLSLFDDNEADEVKETVKPIDNETEQVTYTRRKRKGSKRNIDTSQLPRETLLHDLSLEEKICSCGCEMQKIGEDRAEKIDIIPAQIKVIEHISPKYACKSCESIKAAKKPEFWLPKSMATANLVTEVMVKKYDEHLPLYRQSKILERDGVIIPDNTLGKWVMSAAEILSPLGKALWQQINISRYLQADETRVKILKPDKKGYMWVYQGLDPGNRFVIFEFDLSRAASVAENRLKDFRGILQTDGYYGYAHIGKQESVIHLGCWDHARRKFVDADKVCASKGTGIAGQFIVLINKLYQIDRDIKNESNDKRYQVRQERAKPILNTLFDKAKKINALPKSTLATAIGYLKNNEPQLRRYIEHGHAYMSNCLTENIIRPFALGRKNWLFVGNESSANKSALLYSLIQTCKLNEINIRKYFIYVLNHVHAMRRCEIELKSLLPQFIDPEILN